ncbi:DUF2294 domain-containing protein [Azospirillaceae bacterium]
MLAAKFYLFKKILEEQGIIFSYSGYVSDNVLVGLGEAVRQKMQIDETDTTTTKKVFSVFVEQMQNIIRYSAEKIVGGKLDNSELRSGIIAIGRDDGRFFVTGGNLVYNSDTPKLRQRLEELRNMDKDELKAAYKNRLRQDPEEGSKGASIGLIEIARRSNGPIVFDFWAIDTQFTFFCLKSYI